MTFGRKMDNPVNVMLAHHTAHGVDVNYVGLDKCIVGTIFDILEIGKIAGVSQFVEIYDIVLRIFVDKKSHNMAADKSGTTGDKDISHW